MDTDSMTTRNSEHEDVPLPEITVLSVGQETVSFGIPLTDDSVKYTLELDYCCDTQRDSLIRDDSSPVEVEGLIPGTEYTFSITRIAENGNRSKATSLSVFTEPSPPVQVAVYQVSSQSLSLRWDPPAGDVESYIVTCCHEGEIVQEMTTDTNNLTLSNLSPGVCYSLQVSAQLRNGRKSKPAVTSAHTNVPPPEITVLSVGQETVSFGIPLTDDSVKYTLELDYCCDTQRDSLMRDDSSTAEVEGLIPGTEYTFSITRIAENGNRSTATSLSVLTEPSPPVQIAVYQVSSQSLSLRWDPPAGEVESYIVMCCHEGEIVQEMTTDTNNLTLSNLSPGECYSLQVSAQLRNGRKSKPAVTSAHTNVPPPEITVLSVGQETVSFGIPLTDDSVKYTLELDFCCDKQRDSLTKDESSPVEVEGLIPGTEYTFSITRIADNGNRSTATSLSVFTAYGNVLLT
ncbi:receptor-type tyrosine-protein phosphatase eta-like [Sparus aurata]|uniref:receptor-type tyrosine-protein phosphatase eta-like n=1 Tax=Sparus aurata TaxID=8175 RepID=UPI0011C0CA0E|nr:receptor-type tyrosine-protein phosphatase eta-like [Sparus aurata]